MKRARIYWTFNLRRNLEIDLVCFVNTLIREYVLLIYIRIQERSLGDNSRNVNPGKGCRRILYSIKFSETSFSIDFKLKASKVFPKLTKYIDFFIQEPKILATGFYFAL